MLAGAGRWRWVWLNLDATTSQGNAGQRHGSAGMARISGDPKALGRRTLAALQPAGEGRDLGRGVVALEQLQQGQPSD